MNAQELLQRRINAVTEVLGQEDFANLPTREDWFDESDIKNFTVKSSQKSGATAILDQAGSVVRLFNLGDANIGMAAAEAWFNGGIHPSLESQYGTDTADNVRYVNSKFFSRSDTPVVIPTSYDQKTKPPEGGTVYGWSRGNVSFVNTEAIDDGAHFGDFGALLDATGIDTSTPAARFQTVALHESRHSAENQLGILQGNSYTSKDGAFDRNAYHDAHEEITAIAHQVAGQSIIEQTPEDQRVPDYSRYRRMPRVQDNRGGYDNSTPSYLITNDADKNIKKAQTIEPGTWEKYVGQGLGFGPTRAAELQRANITPEALKSFIKYDGLGRAKEILENRSINPETKWANALLTRLSDEVKGQPVDNAKNPYTIKGEKAAVANAAVKAQQDALIAEQQADEAQKKQAEIDLLSAKSSLPKPASETDRAQWVARAERIAKARMRSETTMNSPSESMTSRIKTAVTAGHQPALNFGMRVRGANGDDDRIMYTPELKTIAKEMDKIAVENKDKGATKGKIKTVDIGDEKQQVYSFKQGNEERWIRRDDTTGLVSIGGPKNRNSWVSVMPVYNTKTETVSTVMDVLANSYQRTAGRNRSITGAVLDSGGGEIMTNESLNSRKAEKVAMSMRVKTDRGMQGRDEAVERLNESGIMGNKWAPISNNTILNMAGMSGFAGGVDSEGRAAIEKAKRLKLSSGDQAGVAEGPGLERPMETAPMYQGAGMAGGQYHMGEGRGSKYTRFVEAVDEFAPDLAEGEAKRRATLMSTKAIDMTFSGEDADRVRAAMKEGKIGVDTYFSKPAYQPESVAEGYTFGGKMREFNDIMGTAFKADSAWIDSIEEGKDGSLRMRGQQGFRDLNNKDEAGKNFSVAAPDSALPKDSSGLAVDLWRELNNPVMKARSARNAFMAEFDTQGIQNYIDTSQHITDEDRKVLQAGFDGKTGRESIEARNTMQKVMSDWYDRERGQIITRNDVHISDTTYNALVEALVAKSPDEGVIKRTFRGQEYTKLDFNDIVKNEEGPGYIIKEMQSVRWQGETLRRARIESTNEGSTINPDTLEMIAEHNPALYKALREQYKPNERALDIAQSYNANENPETLKKLEERQGVSDFDAKRFDEIRAEIGKENPNMGRAEAAKAALTKYGEENEGSIRLDNGLIMPSAQTLAKEVNKGKNGDIGYGFGGDAFSLLANIGSADEQKRGELEQNFRRSYDRMGQSRSIWNKAVGMDIPTPRKLMQAATDIADNEVVISAVQARNMLRKMDGYEKITTKEVKELAKNGELPTMMFMRQPTANPAGAFIGANVQLYEQMDDDFKKRHRNPGAGMYTSEAIAQASQGDFDSDRAVATFVRGMRATSPDRLRYIARFGTANEFGKQVDRFKDIFGGAGQGIIEDEKKLTADKLADNAYRAESLGRGSVGMAYNFSHRLMSRYGTLSTQKAYGTEEGGLAEKISQSASMLAEFSMQRGVDLSDKPDMPLNEVAKMANTGILSGQFISYRSADGKDVIKEETPADLARTLLKKSALIGSSLLGDEKISKEQYMEQIAKPLAVQLSDRAELQGALKDGSYQKLIDKRAEMIHAYASSEGEGQNTAYSALESELTQTGSLSELAFGKKDAPLGSSGSALMMSVAGSMAVRAERKGKPSAGVFSEEETGALKAINAFNASIARSSKNPAGMVGADRGQDILGIQNSLQENFGTGFAATKDENVETLRQLQNQFPTPDVAERRKQAYETLTQIGATKSQGEVPAEYYPRASSQPNDARGEDNRFLGHIASALGGNNTPSIANWRIAQIQKHLRYDWTDPDYAGKGSGLPGSESASEVGRNIHEKALPQLLQEQGVKATKGENYEIIGLKGSKEFFAKGTPDAVIPYQDKDNSGVDQSILVDVKSKTPEAWDKVLSGETDLGKQYGTQTAAYSDMISKARKNGQFAFENADGSTRTTQFNSEYSVVIPTRMVDDGGRVAKTADEVGDLRKLSGEQFIGSIRERVGKGNASEADKLNLSMFERTGIAGHWIKNADVKPDVEKKNTFATSTGEVTTQQAMNWLQRQVGGWDQLDQRSPAEVASLIKAGMNTGFMDTMGMGGPTSLASPSPTGGDMGGAGIGGGGDYTGVPIPGGVPGGMGGDPNSAGTRKPAWMPQASQMRELSKAHSIYSKYQELATSAGDQEAGSAAFREWVSSNPNLASRALEQFGALDRVLNVGTHRQALIEGGVISGNEADGEYRKLFGNEHAGVRQMLAQEGGFMQGVSQLTERRNLENGSRTAEPVGADQISKAATALEVFTTKLGKTSEAFDKTIPSVEKMGDMTDKQLRGVGNAIEMFDTFTKTYDKAIAAKEAGISTPESEEYVQKYGGQIEKMKEEIGPRIEETRQSLARQQAENSLDFGYNKESRRGFLFDISAEGTKLRNQAFEAGEYGGEGALGALGRAGAGFVGGTGRMLQGFFDPGTLWGLRALNSQFINPVMQQAKEYAVSEGKMMSTLAQTGQGGFDDMMSGAYGDIVKAENYRSNQRFETGKQAYAAWSPVVNFAVGGGDQIGGLATSLAGPSLGVGLVAQRLFSNSKVFGANAGMAAGVVGGATALAGLVSYTASNRDNYLDIGGYNNDVEKYRQQQPDNVFGELGARIQALAANPAGGFGNLANATSQFFGTASEEDIKRWEMSPVIEGTLSNVNQWAALGNAPSDVTMGAGYTRKVYRMGETSADINAMRESYVAEYARTSSSNITDPTQIPDDMRKEAENQFNIDNAELIAGAKAADAGVSISDTYSKAEYRNLGMEDWVKQITTGDGRLNYISREQALSAYGFLSKWKKPDAGGFVNPPSDAQVKSFLNFETQGIGADQMTGLLRSRAAAQGLNAADAGVMDTLSNELIAQGDIAQFLGQGMDMSNWANQNLASYNPVMRQLEGRDFQTMSEEAFITEYRNRPETASFLSNQYASWAQGKAVSSAFFSAGRGYDAMAKTAIANDDLLGAQRYMNAPDASNELTAQISAITNPNATFNPMAGLQAGKTYDFLQTITKPLIDSGLEQYNTAYQQYAAANVRANNGQFDAGEWTNARAQQFATFSAKGMDASSLAQMALQAQGVNVNQTTMDDMLSGDFISRVIRNPGLAEQASAALPNIGNINEQRRALGITPIGAFDIGAYRKYAESGNTRRQMSLDEYMGSFNTVNGSAGKTGERTQDFMTRWQSAIDSKDVVTANYYANASKRFSAEESASLESLYGSGRADLYGEFARSEANGQVRGVAQRLMAYNALGSDTAEVASTGNAIRAGVARNVDVASLGEQLASSTTAPKTFEAMSEAVQSFTEAIKVMSPQRMDMLNQAAPGIAQINQQRAFYGQQEMNWASMSDDQLRATAWSPGLQARMQLEQMRGQFMTENGIGAGENSPIANRFANIAARVDQGMLAPAAGVQAASNIQSIMNMGMRYVANGSMEFGDLQKTAANLGEGMNAVQIAQMQAISSDDPYALNNAISSGMVSSISMGTIDSSNGLKIGTASLTPEQLNNFREGNVLTGVGAARLLNDSKYGLNSAGFATVTTQTARPTSGGTGFGTGGGGTQTTTTFKDPSLEGGVMGLQAELIDVQAAAAGASYYYGEMGRQYSMASNMGGGKLDSQGFVVGGNLNQAAAIAKKFGVDFNVGNGMTEWMIDDRQTQIRREQQQYGTQQQQQNLDLQREKLDMDNRHFNEQFGLSQEKFQWQTGFQRKEMEIGRQQQITQQSWQREDMSFNRNQTNLNFGWQMEDMDRNIAFSRGRQRVDLERQQERAVVSYSMQMGRQDTQEKRAEEQIKWADEEFNRKKKNFEEGVAFQLREMDMQKKHHEEQYAFALRQLGLQQEAANKNKSWQEELMKLEDQKRLLDRQGWVVNQNIQRAAAAAQAGAAAKTAELTGKINALTGSQGTNEARVSSLINTGRIFNDVAFNMNAHLTTTNQQLSGIGQSLIAATQNVIQSAQAFSQIPADVNRTNAAFTVMLEGVRRQLGSIVVNIKVNADGSIKAGAANGGFADALFGIGYAEGGYTGYGTNKYAVAGVVHTNEYVVPERGALVVRGDNQQIPYLQKMVDLLQELASNSRGPKVVNNNITNTTGQRSSPYTSLDQAYSRKM